MSRSISLSVVLVVAQVLLVLGSSIARAGILGENLTPYFLVGYNHNSNIYRNPDDEVGVDIFEAALGIRGDLEFGKQALRFDIRQSDRQFDPEDQLDYSPLRANLTFDWAIGGALDGQLILEHDEVLSDYSQNLIPNTSQDVEDRGHQEFNVRVFPSSLVRGFAAVRRKTLEHSREDRIVLDETQEELEAMLQLRTSSGTFLGAFGTWIDGEYPNRTHAPGSIIDDAYKQTNYGAIFEWEPSADTFLELRGGQVERKFDNVSSRDYDSPYWSVDLEWAVSPRLDLGLDYTRDIVSIDNEISSVALRDSLTARADWRATRKLTLLLDISAGEDDFQPVADEEAPKDEYLRGRLRLQYAVLRPLVISLGVEAGNRTSSFDNREYDYTYFTSGIELRL